MRRTVPIMFHSVGLDRLPWAFGLISDPIPAFEANVAALHRKGYRSLFFKDHVPGQWHRRREVVPTFDDGYLDNWVHVLPIMREYDMKGTVFVNPEFADPRDIVRPQVDQAGGFDEESHHPEHCCAGFLSWPEMREMEAGGLFDVQSHALTHTWYFKGPKIVDYWHPGSATEASGPVWMLWNRFPELKPYYLTQAAEWESKIPYGTPVYEYGKALATRRYHPNEELDRILPAYVGEHGGAGFFARTDWRPRLDAFAARYQSDKGAREGHFETEGDYLARVRHELTESKRIIEERLNKRVNSICWPGGGVTAQVVQLAREAGYERYTLPSAWRSAQARNEFTDLSPRLGGAARIWLSGRCLGIWTPFQFMCRVGSFSGSRLHGALLKSMVVAAQLRRRLKRDTT